MGGDRRISSEECDGGNQRAGRHHWLRRSSQPAEHKGKFYALKNRCPHQAGPLCLGNLKGTALPSQPGEYIRGREGEILRCPWHGWEFDATNGRSIWNPHRCRTATYEVTVEPDEEDPSVETYPVTVEAGRLVLHV